jgi:hypothetical protein
VSEFDDELNDDAAEAACQVFWALADPDRFLELEDMADLAAIQKRLAAVQAKLDDAIRAAAQRWREGDDPQQASWVEIGEALGMPWRAAKARYGLR